MKKLIVFILISLVVISSGSGATKKISELTALTTISGTSLLEVAYKSGGTYYSRKMTWLQLVQFMRDSVLMPDSITTGMIASDVITSRELASNSVGAAELAANAIDSNDVASGGINSTNIHDHTITATDLSTTVLAMMGEYGAGTYPPDDVSLEFLIDGADTTLQIKSSYLQAFYNVADTTTLKTLSGFGDGALRYLKRLGTDTIGGGWFMYYDSTYKEGMVAFDAGTVGKQWIRTEWIERKNVVNVDWCGSITKAIDKIGSNAYTLELTRPMTPTGTAVFPSTMTLSIIGAGKIIHNHPYTVTINAKLLSDNHQRFECFDPGEVTFDTAAAQFCLPEWWGAAADGSTDDKEEIRSAFRSGLPHVYFSGGTYNMTDSAHIGPKVRKISGTFGSTIRNIRNDKFSFFGNGNDDLVISDLNFLGNIDSTCYPIYITSSDMTTGDVSNLTIENNRFYNMGTVYGVGAGGGICICYAKNLKILGNTFDTFDNNAINVAFSSDYVINGNIIKNFYSDTHYGHAIVVDGAKTTYIANGVISNNTMYNLKGAQGVLFHTGKNIIIVGNVFDSVGTGVTAGTTVLGVNEIIENVTITGNVFVGSTIGSMSIHVNCAILVQGSVSGPDTTWVKNVNISGNVFRHQNKIDTLFEGGGVICHYVDGVTISDNYFIDVAKQGIMLGFNCYNLNIDGNYIHDLTHTNACGIQFSIYKYNGIVQNNFINDAVYGILANTPDSTGGTVTLRGNRFGDNVTYKYYTTNGIFTFDEYEATVTWNPGSLNDGAGETSAAIVTTGAKLGDFVSVAAPYDLQGITCNAYVYNTDTVKVRIQNETTGTIDLASGVWRVKLMKPY